MHAGYKLASSLKIELSKVQEEASLRCHSKLQVRRQLLLLLLLQLLCLLLQLPRLLQI